MVYFKVLSWHLHGEYGENQEAAQVSQDLNRVSPEYKTVLLPLR